MHWTLVVIGSLVAWALLGSLWRPASLALVMEWMAGQAFWIATGESLPLALYWVLDPCVMFALFRWRSTALDWFIMGGFPVAWAGYVWLEGAEQWWFLWAVMCGQLLLAGPWKQTQRSLGRFSHGPLRTRMEL